MSDVNVPSQSAVVAASLVALLSAAAAPACAQSKSPDTVLTISAITQYATGRDEINTVSPWMVNRGQADVAVDFTHRFGRRVVLDLNYNPVAVDNTAGRTYTAAGKPIQSMLYRDYQSTATLIYTLQRQVALQAGYFYHARVCCPGAGDPSNPAPSAERVAFLEADFSTRPLTKLGAAFTYGVRGNAAFHRPNVAFLKTKGYEDSNRTETGVQQTISGVVPLAARGTLGAFGSLTWGAQDYYDGAPVPYAYDTFNYGFRSAVARNVTFQVANNVRTQRLQGYPNVFPQAGHRAVLIVSLSYRIPLDAHR